MKIIIREKESGLTLFCVGGPLGARGLAQPARAPSSFTALNSFHAHTCSDISLRAEGPGGRTGQQRADRLPPEGEAAPSPGSSRSAGAAVGRAHAPPVRRVCVLGRRPPARSAMRQQRRGEGRRGTRTAGDSPVIGAARPRPGAPSPEGGVSGPTESPREASYRSLVAAPPRRTERGANKLWSTCTPLPAAPRPERPLPAQRSAWRRPRQTGFGGALNRAEAPPALPQAQPPTFCGGVPISTSR